LIWSQKGSAQRLKPPCDAQATVGFSRWSKHFWSESKGFRTAAEAAVRQKNDRRLQPMVETLLIWSQKGSAQRLKPPCDAQATVGFSRWSKHFWSSRWSKTFWSSRWSKHFFFVLQTSLHSIHMNTCLLSQNCMLVAPFA